MQNLILMSRCHQRYEDGKPVLGEQFCGRAIKIENKNFSELFKGLPVTPQNGFLVTMYNMDTPNFDGTYNHMMQPKLMELVADTGNEMLLKGVALTAMGNVVMDYSDYGLTLTLENRKVVGFTLHLYDRNVDIEYTDLLQDGEKW